MKHKHEDTHHNGHGFSHPSHGFGGGGGGGGGPRGRRPLSHGDIRLLLLALIAEEPCHGYDLIRRIEALSGASYTPSPGVIYPTLAWLEETGLATVAQAEGRKSFTATAAGQEHLRENRAEAEAIAARLSGMQGQGRHNAPAPVLRAMENLKLALRLRLAQGVTEDALAEIAAAIDTAAQKIERTK